MEEPRKTSNGCKVTRRVQRRDARCHQTSECIAAIDFGTTNCSVAYLLPGQSEQDPQLLLFDTEKRIPTAVLFNKEGTVEEFGKAAREACISLNGEKLMERPYFEYIKMNLQHDKVTFR